MAKLRTNPFHRWISRRAPRARSASSFPSAQPAPALSEPRKPRRLRRFARIVGATFLLLILLGVAARLALPSYLRSYVNRTIDQSPDYEGSVGDIDVHLWRGAYTIHDVKIVKRTHRVPIPFVDARTVDLALDWNSLAHGVARGRINIEHASLNFVHSPSREESQTGVNQPWLGIIDDLFPFRIDKCEITDSEIHFHTVRTSPPVNLYLSEVSASIENLTNVEDSTEPLVARVHASGTAMDTGRFKLDLTLDPKSHRPSFDLAARLIDVDVTRLNALTRAYGDFDFEGGKFDFVLEVSTRNGFLQGYAKPLFRNVTVLGLRDFKDKDIFHVFWEALVGATTTAFKNQPRDQFGTRITLQGDLDNPQTSLLEIIGNVLRNAFIQAYLPRIEGHVAPDAARNSDAHATPPPRETP